MTGQFEEIVTLPDGRRARITGPSQEAIMETAARLGAQQPQQPAMQPAMQSAMQPRMLEAPPPEQPTDFRSRVRSGIENMPVMGVPPAAAAGLGHMMLGGESGGMAHRRASCCFSRHGPQVAALR